MPRFLEISPRTLLLAAVSICLARAMDQDNELIHTCVGPDGKTVETQCDACDKCRSSNPAAKRTVQCHVPRPKYLEPDALRFGKAGSRKDRVPCVSTPPVEWCLGPEARLADAA